MWFLQHYALADCTLVPLFPFSVDPSTEEERYIYNMQNGHTTLGGVSA